MSRPEGQALQHPGRHYDGAQVPKNLFLLIFYLIIFLFYFRHFLQGCGVCDFDHVLRRIFTDFIQMIYFSRQFSRHGNPGFLIHINYDEDSLTVSHEGESYTHQEVYDFLGHEVHVLIFIYIVNLFYPKLF